MNEMEIVQAEQARPLVCLGILVSGYGAWLHDKIYREYIKIVWLPYACTGLTDWVFRVRVSSASGFLPLCYVFGFGRPAVLYRIREAGAQSG